MVLDYALHQWDAKTMTGVGRIRIGAVWEIIRDILLLHTHYMPGSVPSARRGHKVCRRGQHGVPEGHPAPGGSAGT